MVNKNQPKGVHSNFIMAQTSQQCPFNVIYKDKSWKKFIRLKNGNFDKVYSDLSSYVTKRTKLTLGTQCHITINDNVIYSTDDLQLELENANGNNLDVIVNVCNVMHVMHMCFTYLDYFTNNIPHTIYNLTVSGWSTTTKTR